MIDINYALMMALSKRRSTSRTHTHTQILHTFQLHANTNKYTHANTQHNTSNCQLPPHSPAPPPTTIRAPLAVPCTTVKPLKSVAAAIAAEVVAKVEGVQPKPKAKVSNKIKCTPDICGTAVDGLSYHHFAA